MSNKFKVMPNSAINLTGESGGEPTFEEVSYELAGQNGNTFVASVINLKDDEGNDRRIMWINPLKIKLVKPSLHDSVLAIASFAGEGYSRIDPTNTCDMLGKAGTCERFRDPLEHALYLNS